MSFLRLPNRYDSSGMFPLELPFYFPVFIPVIVSRCLN
jgi:hypothetical protein